MTTLVAEKEVYLWTMLPNEAVVGNGEWTDSNPEMRVTAEGNDTWSFTMVPTEFYGVDSSAFIDKGWWVSLKVKSPKGTFEPMIKKTEDLALIPEQADYMIPTDSLDSSPLTVITHHQMQFAPIKNNISVLPDVDGKMTIEEALQAFKKKKFVNTYDIKDKSINRFWVSFNTVNNSQHDQLYDIAVFSWEESEIHELDTLGNLTKLTLNDEESPAFSRAFVLELKSGESKRLFVKLTKDIHWEWIGSITQTNLKRWKAVEAPFKLRFVFILAVLSFALCFYLLWYAITRKKELIYYVLMWLGFLVMLVFPTGPGSYAALGYKAMKYVDIELIWAMASSLNVWGILGFSIHYLRLSEFYKPSIAWARYIAIAPLSMFLLATAYHLFPGWFPTDPHSVVSFTFFPLNTMRGFFVILAFIFVYAMGIFQFIRGFKPALYFIIAFLPLTVAAIVTSMSVLITAVIGLPMGIPPEMMLANYISQFLALLLFAMAMAFREKTLEKEHDKAQNKAMNHQLALKEQEVRLEKEKAEQEQLKELDTLKSRFFANISHELRTPLTIILAQNQRIQKELKEASLDPKFEMVDRNGQRLLELINQMLDLAKLETGKMVLKPKSIDLIPYLKNQLFSFESLAEEKNVILNFNSNKNKLITAVDPEKLERVIFNLLSNAIKFTTSGSHIDLSVNASDQDVSISIADMGHGISKEDLPHIFNRFYQSEYSDDQTHLGTGIGLALAKELVSLHNGGIRVKSEIGKGSIFTVDLPKEAGQNEEVDYQAQLIPVADFKVNGNSNGHVSTQNEQEQILVVEDNPDVRSLLKEQLSELGYRINEAEDGQQGLDTARDILPDLIISDVMMPKMNGLEFAQAIREDERSSHIPLILLTAKASEESKITGLETGVDAYLTKPFNLKELSVRVKSLIQQRKMLRERFSLSSSIKPKEVSAVPADQVFLDKVIHIIEERLTDSQFGLDPLSEEVGMSATHLNRKLNALIGQSAGKLIRSYRLKHAAHLIKNKAANISEIAYELGFNNPTNFSRSFKQQFGVSPTEYEG